MFIQAAYHPILAHCPHHHQAVQAHRYQADNLHGHAVQVYDALFSPYGLRLWLFTAQFSTGFRINIRIGGGSGGHSLQRCRFIRREHH